MGKNEIDLIVLGVCTGNKKRKPHNQNPNQNQPQTTNTTNHPNPENK